MSNKYYYLVSSLPHLTFLEEPPVSKDFFLEEAEKWLSPSDMKVLLSADVHSPEEKETDTLFLKEWKRFDLFLKEELAHVRAQAKTGESRKMPEEVQDIIGKENPLLMEKEMELIRWNFLEEKLLQHHFDLNWLILYFLKLQILERLEAFDKDKGDSTFYKLCEVKHEQAVG